MVTQKQAITNILNPKARCWAGHHRTAKRLANLSGGLIEIGYNPNTLIEDQPASTGHIFHGNLSNDVEENEGFIHLDNRTANMEGQLIAELNRIGDLYHTIAATKNALTMLREHITGEKVFPWSYRQADLNLEFDVLLRAAKVPKRQYLGSHSIRRSVGMLMTQNYGLEVAQLKLGHQNIETTRKHYAAAAQRQLLTQSAMPSLSSIRNGSTIQDCGGKLEELKNSVSFPNSKNVANSNAATS